MARNITEAKQYLVHKIREMAANILKYPPEDIEVIFKDKRAFATAHGDLDDEGNVRKLWVSIDEKTIRANISNIENPIFLDAVRHELSHLKDYEKFGKTETRFGHGSRFRKIYKEHYPGHESGLRQGFISGSPTSYGEDRFFGTEKSTGLYGYGYASPETLDATLRVCTSCGHVGIYKPARKRESKDPLVGYWKCPVCRGKLMTIKRLSQRELLDHLLANDKYGESEMQDHLRRKYARYLSKLPYRQIARVAKRQKAKRITILDRAKNLTLGKRFIK